MAHLPGVRSSAAVLRENVSVAGPRGAKAVQMLGVTPGIVNLGSLDTKNFGAGGFRFSEGLILPAGVASAIGAEPGSQVTVLAAGGAHRVKVGAVLSGSLFGALTSSPVAIALLAVAQRLTGLPGRVTQVLVQPRPGSDRFVTGELARIAGGRLDVSPAGNELRLLDQAIEPNSQSTELFSAISVMVGFLLALNAMLLTMPERRRFVADLRVQGYDRRQVLVLLSFQALALGVLASLVGVTLGDALSSAFFHRVPNYLAAAFPIGAKQIVHPKTVIAAFACGVIATVLASLTPVVDLREGRAVDAVFRESGGRGETIGKRATTMLGIAGMASIAAVTALVLLAPGMTIVGGVALALSTLLLIPAMFAGIAQALPWMGDHIRSSALIVAVSELRATSMRAVALAGIAGLAVYGSIAMGGARGDLIRGIDHATAQYFGTADIWVGTGQDIFNVNRFEPQGTVAAIARAPGVASVRVLPGGPAGRRRPSAVGPRETRAGPRDGGSQPAARRRSGAQHTAAAPWWVGRDLERLRRRTPPARRRDVLSAHTCGRGDVQNGRDHDELGLAAGDDHDQRRGLPPLLADRRPLGAGGEPAPRRQRRRGQTSGHRRAGRSPGTVGADELGTRPAIGVQRATGTGDTRRDLHAAADRGRPGGRLGAERGRVAAARAARLAEDPGI